MQKVSLQLYIYILAVRGPQGLSLWEDVPGVPCNMSQNVLPLWDSIDLIKGPRDPWGVCTSARSSPRVNSLVVSWAGSKARVPEGKREHWAWCQRQKVLPGWELPGGICSEHRVTRISLTSFDCAVCRTGGGRESNPWVNLKKERSLELWPKWTQGLVKWSSWHKNSGAAFHLIDGGSLHRLRSIA